MSEKKRINPIVIDIVHDVVGKSGKDLQYCFFLPSEIEGFYNFLDEFGRTLATGVSSNHPFPFLHDGHAWTINNFLINDQRASGNWSNSAPTPLQPPGPGQGSGEDQDGSFQASSSGGVVPEAATEVKAEAAPVLPVGAIEIKTVTGGSDKDKLKGCYFMYGGTTWSLYNKSGDLLQSGFTSATSFTFNHDSNKPNGTKITWTVTSFAISATAASGNWSNPDDPTVTGEQDGTFQASSSGGVEPEAINEPAAAAPAGSLEIKTVTGGSDKDKLKDCYFVVSGSTWSLYNKNGVLLASGQTSATGFTFEHDSNKPSGTKITWTITNFVISTTAASGNWSNPDSITGDQDGTFQASSSGGVGEGQVAAGASA